MIKNIKISKIIEFKNLFKKIDYLKNNFQKNLLKNSNIKQKVILGNMTF
jgi:hypothetical protein